MEKDQCEMRVSYNRSIGGITGGLIVFTIFMINLIAFLGGCCCYRSCKKRYPIETEPTTTLNTQHTSVLLKSKNQKFNVAPPAGNLTDTDVLSRNINRHQLSMKDDDKTVAGSISSISPMAGQSSSL